MRKIGASKSKKGAPVKEEQRITSFFNKLVVQNTKSSNSNNKEDEQPSSSNKHSTNNDKYFKIDNQDLPCTEKNVKIRTNKTKVNGATKKKTPVKGKNITAAKSLENENADSSDSDFVVDKKDKAKSNILEAFKSKHKFIYNRNTTENDTKVPVHSSDVKATLNINKKLKGDKKENSLSPPNSKKKRSPLNKDSQLIVNLQAKYDLKQDLQKIEDSAYPEKTYLQRDKILLDITQSSNYFEAVKSFEITAVQNSANIFSQSHSSPYENTKKPDTIRNDKISSPPRKKFSVTDKTENNYILNTNLDKKLTDQKLTLQLSPKSDGLTVKSTTIFIVSPVKCISPSKSSPQKGEKLKSPVSPSKSNMKLKRSLFLSNKKMEEPLKQIVNAEQENKSETIKETSDELEDLFDDDWDVEINQIEDKINQLNLENWQYCKTLEVSRDNSQNLIIKLESIENKQQTSCVLQGLWQYLNLQSEDIVNILAVKNSGDIPYCINNNEGFLIYEPDILISPTSITGSLFCKRRGILSERFRGFESENKMMIIGTLVHKLLQDVLKKEIFKPDLVQKRLLEILATRNMINTSYSSQIPIGEIKNELMPFIPKIVNFVEKYIRNDKKKAQFSSKPEDWNGKIHSIQDIEENIWCTQLGIKGKVDVTIKTNNFEHLPLELKTGRASMSPDHKGQVIMYIMIMKELGYNISKGLLLYLREEIVREVSASPNDKRDLIMLRNEFAYYVKQKPKVLNSSEEITENKHNSQPNAKSVMPELDPLKQLKYAELPEPINHHSACGNCPYANICTVFLSRDDTSILSESNPLNQITSELLQRLEQNHIDYFIHWTSLLTLESNYKPPIKALKDIWRLPPYKREGRGKSICYLKISSRVTEINDSFIHTFTRTTDEKIIDLILEKGLKNDFLASNLLVNNYIVISTETRHAIATGFITDISNNSVTVSLERNLSERYSNNTFHLDTYESQNIVNFSFTSVAALLEATEPAKRLRELIIDRQPSIIGGDLTKSVVTVGASILRKLNKIQQRAVLKALTVKDYLLIKGMPGTGKTATIVALIELLVKLNKTVLITSHTHSAVDNVCLRLLKCGVDILRLGSESRVDPQLKHRTESVLTAHCNTVEELQQVYDSARVVAVTCLAAGHPMLNQRKLDICIVDESTQVLQCSVIKALLSSNSFILIGDPEQLPPVVRNPEAVRRGMSESLFERLDNLDSTISLNLQYRMNKTITDLANSVTYKGELLCADETISSAVLNLPKLEELQSLYIQEQWILSTLDSKLENSVIAIDTGPTWNISTEQKNTDDNLLTELQVAPQNVEEDEERRCSNNYEAAIVISIVQALKKAGVSSNSVGVITPYRAQVNLLKKLIFNISKDENCEPVEVNTVDQYQGRDKEVIIYSCTRSRNVTKAKNNTGFEILDDKRRLTVAITRAKHKLIMIGDFITLKEYSPFKKLLDSLNSHQKVILKDEICGFRWEQVFKRLDS